MFTARKGYTMTISNTRKPPKFRRFATLRIKAASLAAEAKIIRREEIKARDSHLRTVFAPTRVSLYHHRVTVVRTEARATHLALAYLRGTPYSKVERPLLRVSEDLLKRAFDMARRHAPAEMASEQFSDFLLWVDYDAVRPGLIAAADIAASREKLQATA